MNRVFTLNDIRTWAKIYDSGHTVSRLEDCISISADPKLIWFYIVLIRLELL